jgi:YebC/PmpR family DNA-binding regulatory protein
MAGHSKFKNIQHRKGAQDKKRAKVFTKAVKEIIVAAKSGQPDPNFNPRLRTALIAARAVNLPKDRVEKALAQATSAGSGDNYDEIRYEGYAPGGIAIIVEALTDNRNRTAGEVRSTFNKHGGNMGEMGSVSFMFDKLGMIEFPPSIGSADQVLEAAIEAGAENVESDDESHLIYTRIEDYGSVLEFLTEKFGDPIESQIGWKPHNNTMITDLEKAEKLLRMIDVLEDLDDVQNVFGAYEFSEEVMKELS